MAHTVKKTNINSVELYRICAVSDILKGIRTDVFIYPDDNPKGIEDITDIVREEKIFSKYYLVHIVFACQIQHVADP